MKLVYLTERLSSSNSLEMLESALLVLHQTAKAKHVELRRD